MELFGFTPTAGTPEHGRWNKAVGIYRKLKADPDMVRRVHVLYQKHYQHMDLNALAVAGRAEHLLAVSARAPNPNSAGVPHYYRFTEDAYRDVFFAGMDILDLQTIRGNEHESTVCGIARRAA